MLPPDLTDRADDVLAGKSRGYVDDARVFAHALLKVRDDLRQLSEHLQTVQRRCTELREDRRVLKDLIKAMSAADPTARDALLADAVKAVEGMP